MAAGRPHPAVALVGALVLATYLVASVRLAPLEVPAAAVTPDPRATPPARPSADPGGAPTPSSSSAASFAILGDAIDTPYGVAQVRVSVIAGRLEDVEAVLLPSASRRSETISNSVEPWLRKRAIAAQSAQFDVLSGATYTSRAYQGSLETALRAAGLSR
jgi:uncharacterized protein with FMN-binding domain